uniref:integrin alpha-11-like n=1 Tax=Myxine glutinosa TaxID=7769 RepID=UPI00358F42D3
MLISPLSGCSSRSIVDVDVTVTFSPTTIDLLHKSCYRSSKEATCIRASVCFTATAYSPRLPRSTIALSMLAELDSPRLATRALFNERFHRQVQKNLTVFVGQAPTCRHLGFYLHEVTDFLRPISFSVQYSLQDPHSDPVLNAFHPTSLESKLPFAKDCGPDGKCVADLIVNLHTAVPQIRDPPYIIDSEFRRFRVSVMLLNKGEVAYNAHVNITISKNLRLASITTTADQKVQLDCQYAPGHTRWIMCSFNPPVLFSHFQLPIHLELEFNHLDLLRSIEVGVHADSDSDEKPETMEDNEASLSIPVRYKTDILFTRETNFNHYEIGNEIGIQAAEESKHQYNFTFKVQNLGMFPVEGLQVHLAVPGLSVAGNPLMSIADVHTDGGAVCTIFLVKGWPEHGKSLTLQDETFDEVMELDCESTHCHSVECSLGQLGVHSALYLTFTGHLWSPSFHQMNFKRLKLNSSAELKLLSPLLVLKEVNWRRYVSIDVTKERWTSVPLWIILGSILGGLLLLALLTCILWKAGFFRRRYILRDSDTEGHEILVEDGQETNQS